MNTENEQRTKQETARTLREIYEQLDYRGRSEITQLLYIAKSAPELVGGQHRD